MAKQSNRGGLTRGKAIAIGILSAVLLLTIVLQFGGQGERVAKSAAAPPAVAATSESPSAAAPTGDVQRRATSWPAFKVAEVVASNPFMLPESLRPKREAVPTLTPNLGLGENAAGLSAVEPAEIREMRRRQAEFMAGLQAKGVDMILRSPRGSVAIVGDLRLRIGDVHEGLRVEAIGENGVTFTPAVIADGQRE